MLLSDDQLLLQERVRRFARTRLLPTYVERDRHANFGRELLVEMGELGILAREVAQLRSGKASRGVDTGIIVEELAYGDFSMAGVAVVQSLCATILERSATEAIRTAWLERVIRGDALLAIAITEEHAGSDAAAIRLQARRVEGGYLLDGEKWSVNFSETADAYVVFAQLASSDGGAAGITTFLVPAASKGIEASRYENLSSRLGRRGTVRFNEVFIPKDHLVGDEGRGFTEVMRGFDFTRALIALQCIGAASASLDEAWAYTKSRTAFGGPIARFQGVTFPLVDAEAHLAAGRQLAYHALELRDLGRDHTVEAALVKSIIPRVAFDAIHSCILTFGQFACTFDSPHQQRLRDVMGLELGEGTENIMKMIVARHRTDRIAAFK